MTDVSDAAARFRRTENGEDHKTVYGFDGEVMDDFNYRMLENAYVRDYKVLAKAYLAEHPADDAEPITVDADKVEDYPQAARSIALWLKRFCDNRLKYPAMIAEAARRAAKHIESLEPPSDSALPITEEWLRAVGFEYGERWIGEPNTAMNLDQLMYDCGTKEMHIGEAELETRGDLRNLCTAIGITLKEPE